MAYDFDFRVRQLNLEINPSWDSKVQEQHRAAQDAVKEGLFAQYGAVAADQKLTNFTDWGHIPMSVIAYHNSVFRQARDAFVIGGYYPALTALVALGERILNHLVLGLRDNYQHTAEYKAVYRKKSFANWSDVTRTLVSWGVLRPEVAPAFRDLEELRNRVLHFSEDTVPAARELALSACSFVRDVVEKQFSAFGPNPWFITSVPGVVFIKRSWEDQPFIRLVYIPNCAYVGPDHYIERDQVNCRWIVIDETEASDREIGDEEYARLHEAARAARSARANG